MAARKPAVVDKPAAYPLDVVAGMIGCSENHVYKLINLGQLRAIDISLPTSKVTKLRVRADDLQAFLDERSA